MAGAVDVSLPGLLNAWRSDEDGSMWIQLRLQGGTSQSAVDAITEAVSGANKAINATLLDPVITASPPAVTSRGPVVFLDFCDSQEALERWTSELAGKLAQEGWSGQIRTIVPEATPHDSPLKRVECVTAGLVLAVDQKAIDDQLRLSGTAPGWYVDEDTTVTAVGLAADFCLDGPGDIYVRHQDSQFRVSSEDAERLAAAAILRGPTVSLTRIGPEGSVHRVLFWYQGHVLYELRPTDLDWATAARTLGQVLRSHASIADYGLVRQSLTHAFGWDSLDDRPPRLPRVGSYYTQKWRHLENSRVPDAYGIQLLGDAHMQRPTDLTGWRIEPVASGKYLVSAPNLDPWFAHEQPEESILDQARHNFGNMILDKAALR